MIKHCLFLGALFWVAAACPPGKVCVWPNTVQNNSDKPIYVTIDENGIKLVKPTNNTDAIVLTPGAVLNWTKTKSD